ncbi:hypothetical protein ACUSIJ_27000 [Pseudochelatococcus sp. B33]
MTVAAIGECVLKLSSTGGKAFELSFGGDTLNTAVYLAPLGIPVDYVTALGAVRALTSTVGKTARSGAILAIACNRSASQVIATRSVTPTRSGLRTFDHVRGGFDDSPADQQCLLRQAQDFLTARRRGDLPRAAVEERNAERRLDSFTGLAIADCVALG